MVRLNPTNHKASLCVSYRIRHGQPYPEVRKYVPSLSFSSNRTLSSKQYYWDCLEIKYSSCMIYELI